MTGFLDESTMSTMVPMREKSKRSLPDLDEVIEEMREYLKVIDNLLLQTRGEVTRLRKNGKVIAAKLLAQKFDQLGQATYGASGALRERIHQAADSSNHQASSSNRLRFLYPTSCR